ncbi:hypothetical protein [Rhodanobacter sp. C01]|uniref:hypothetical protein n=1 Tax=Rhodanobacter sp. C01 TaxID=1945856 RepID=UPI001C2C7479|nr:hypothetical protein [Rhodanobacter sp. C01]
MTMVIGSAHGAAFTDASPPAQVPALGAHTLLVQTEGKGVSPAVSKPLTTEASGSSLLVLISSYASNSDDPTDSYSNTWKQLGPSVIYNGYDGKFNARAYVVLSARGGANHTVSITKSGDAGGEISVPIIEIRHAGVLKDVAQNYPVPGTVGRVTNKLARVWHDVAGNPSVSSTSLTSGSVTTTGPATLIAVWWGDATVYSMTAVPDSGFKVIDSFLELPPNSGTQCAVAFRQVAAAGTYSVTWTGSPAQGAILWLFAFQSGG